MKSIGIINYDLRSKDVLGSIFQTIMEKQNATVLDIGFGTGTLTMKLYEHGRSIYGQDFSSRMIELTSENKLNQCKQEAGDAWDDEEISFVFDELANVLPNSFI